MSAAPAPCFSTLLSGQPIFMSTPSKPSFTASAAAFSIISGFEVKNCATIGRSSSEYTKSSRSFFFPFSGAKTRPSAETNSVHITSGFPYFAMIRRKAASVTSASGAKARIGFCSVCQKFFIRMSLTFFDKNEQVVL